MRWTAPARLHHDVGATEVGAPVAEGFTHTNVHLITPETPLSCTYFWGSGYNRLVDDAEVLRQMREATQTIFETQDGTMIAAQQRAMGPSVDLVAQHPVMLEPDEPAIRARRILARLIREESGVNRDRDRFARALP
jgi:vanillate O-demethylase monooxygenase subunit